MRILNFLFMLSLILLIGCQSKPLQIRALEKPIPFKDASLFPGAAENKKIAVSAYVNNDDYQESMFAASMEDEGFWPVLITVSNNSNRKIMTARAPVLTIGKKIVKPEKLIYVSQKIQGWDTSDTIEMTAMCILILPFLMENAQVVNDVMKKNEALVQNLNNKVYRKTILFPGQTAVGYLFYDTKEVPDIEKAKLEMRCQTLDRVQYITVSCPVKKAADD